MKTAQSSMLNELIYCALPPGGCAASRDGSRSADNSWMHGRYYGEGKTSVTCLANCVTFARVNTLKAPTEEAGSISIESVEQFARDTVSGWSALCQKFLDTQRSQIFERAPSPKQLEAHRSALKWLLRFGRVIHMTAADPDYPDRRVADELEGRLLQLEHSWRMVHVTMPAGDAEEVLNQVFPG